LAKTLFTVIFAVIISVAYSSPVPAAVRGGSKTPPSLANGGFFITPTISGFSFSGSEQRKFTPLYGVKFGYDSYGKSIIDSLGLEGTLNYFTPGSGSAGYLVRVDTLFPFISGKNWIPFLALGAGGVIVNGGPSADKNPMLDYGVGLKYFLEDYLALRVDVRHMLVYSNVNTHNDVELGIGVSYYFGKERKKTPPPLPDSDGDGVPDELDKCPDTPKGVKVDRKGCPEDSDKDGVPDYLDKCPNTPMGVPVDKSGCPPENGANGQKPAEAKKAVEPEKPAVVIAPEPPKTLAVVPPLESVMHSKEAEAEALLAKEAEAEALRAKEAAAGDETVKLYTKIICLEGHVQAETATPLQPPAPQAAPAPVPAGAEEKVLRLIDRKFVRKLTVEFPFDRYYIRPKYHKGLNEIAAYLKSSPGSAALIEGHTDSVGSKYYNFKLSKQRAESVKSMLIKFGADPHVIATKGYGPTRPIVANTTKEGRQRNRRAVTKVTIAVYSATEGPTAAGEAPAGPAAAAPPAKAPVFPPVILSPGTTVVIRSGKAPPQPVPASPDELERAREAATVEEKR
jgi:OmpA-OmpF porin, OOP family